MTSGTSLHATAARTIETVLAAWMPGDPNQNRLRREYIAFVHAGAGAALDRDGGPEHVTASCFVFTPDLSQVLLCFHRKGQFWVQLGGHIESTDESVPAAALREAREEGGIVALRPVGASPVDVHRHALSAQFGRCGTHWDIGYVAIAAADATPAVSAESEDVAWWPTARLPEQVPSGFGDRIAVVLTELERQRRAAESSTMRV